MLSPRQDCRGSVTRTAAALQKSYCASVTAEKAGKTSMKSARVGAV
jgi:hypothetical protein